MRLLVFLLCLGVGGAAVLIAAGGWRGRGAGPTAPTVPMTQAPSGGARVPLASGGSGSLTVENVGAPRFAMQQALTWRDERTGARVDIPHFVPWSFESRAARAVVDAKADDGSILFEDVTVVQYRPPETLAEAERLRDDPRAIAEFVRMVITAPRARADGIARALSEQLDEAGAQSAIVLDGGVTAHDQRLEIHVRGQGLTFDPRSHVTRGQGAFIVEHAAWTLEGMGFTLAPQVRDGRPDFDAAFRLEIDSKVLLAVRENVLGSDGRTLVHAEDFRPARVFAGRAGVVHDRAAPGGGLHIALEQGVRALQQGGRRLLCDRLTLALEPRGPNARVEQGLEGARGWQLDHLLAEGRPVTIEMPDLQTSGGQGGTSQAWITARRLRHEPAEGSPATTVLEGEPAVRVEGDLAFTGARRTGSWLHASAVDRIVIGPAPGVGLDPVSGTPVAGRRLELRGRARIERRDVAGADAPPASDVLEGDEIALVLRPSRPEDGVSGREVAQTFAALGHVTLGGTRLVGTTDRIVVERLDTLEPRVIVEGEGTQIAFVGFAPGQRLLGAAPPEAETAADAEPKRSWVLDRLDARGPVSAETQLGGPTVGVQAWVEGQGLGYDRLSDRALLQGAAGRPARVEMAADATRRHALVAPRIAFEVARGRVRTEDGSTADVYVAAADDGAGLSGGLAGPDPVRGEPERLEITTDGRIELDLVLDKPGGELAAETPQRVRVLAPFRARMHAPAREAVDTLRAERLEAMLALRSPTTTSVPSAAVARPAKRAASTPHSATPPTASPAAPAKLDRWRLTSRALTFDLEAGTLGRLMAEGDARLVGETLDVTAATVRFERALGALLVEGGEHAVRARFGPTGGRSGQLIARALRVAIDEGGPRWLLASGPVEADLVEEDPRKPGEAQRYQIHAPGDVRVTDVELVTQGGGTTFARRSLRKTPTAPWGETTELWAERITAVGEGLLGLGRATAKGGVKRVEASGPTTTLITGEGGARMEMWCERIEVDVLGGLAVLLGGPDREVIVHRADGHAVEFSRASFDFRTGEIEGLEAGRAVLRRTK
jgi:hypothetical protein